MSGIPTIPSIDSANLGAALTSQGATLTAGLTLDMCNARPIWVYVVPGEGKIWRIFDPLSPAEKLPVWKEWSEEVTRKKPKWKLIPVYPAEPPDRPQQPDRCHVDIIRYLCDGATFKFDEPGRSFGVGDPGAFNDPSRPAAIQQEIDRDLNAPAQDGHPLPSQVERKIVMFGHADMTANFDYNHGLTDRRNRGIKSALSHTAQSKLINVGACSDFNPEVGPNEHERAAEKAPTGKASNPGSGPSGNLPNRRVELLVIPDYRDPEQSVIKPILESIHEQLQRDLSAKGISAPEWQRGTFPCAHAKTICHKLTNPFDSPLDPANPSLEQRRHQSMDAQGNATASGPDYRQCAFYKLFKQRIQQALEFETRQTPPELPPQQPQEARYRKEPDGYEEIKETINEYHPPPGEHYGYYMDNMVKTGVNAGPQLAPQIAVAPNRPDDLLDFNLLRPGAIKVVKMDIGFWGDQRVRDVSRRAGIRRTPKRAFGMVEGAFVFLCYFETPDNAGFQRGCSDQFDDKLTPLAATLAQAVRDSGNRIFILAKTVAEDGPDASTLNVFFPDMHMPRKFDTRDPRYASSPCVRRVEMVKSMVLQQLKRDYRLQAEQTPWLSVEDRRLCRDFFEGDAAKLKLPHWSTGRRFSNPFDPDGDDFLSAATDAVKKAYQALMQTGFYMFEFDQDDLRRMVRKYPDNFPEKGYGRTKDVLFNWFYGFETDKNTPPPVDDSTEGQLKGMIPAIVSEVADTNFGTDLGPDAGTPPAAESYDKVDPGPARDMLRFLKVIGEQIKDNGQDIQVFQTGDLHELWANRRFLFEDFALTDDPAGQLPETAAGLMPSEKKDEGFLDTALGVLKSIGSGFVQILLGGINANPTDLWFRREANKRAPEAPLPDEQSWNVDSIGDDWQIPRFQKPTGAPVGVQTDPQHNQLKTATVDYTQNRLTGLNEDPERGKSYLRSETQRRIQQVLAFQAPKRDNAEDNDLVGAFTVGQDEARWNAAVVDKFGKLNTKFIYGNHDCYRGVPREDGVAAALPFYSVPGLWVEHGHRFEDSNLDGQPFGAFITNLAYEIQELASAEGLLDEYKLHREQSIFQPGIIQWFLLTEFGLNSLEDFKNPPDGVPAVSRFRIAINSHTHNPDLVNAQIVFGQRESTPWESIINLGGAAVKALLLIKQFLDWWEAWDNRNGFDKWWEDIKGNTINWGVDFGGLTECLEQGWEYLKDSQAGKSVESLIDEAEKSGESIRDTLEDNFG